jgi:hypothetical protein
MQPRGGGCQCGAIRYEVSCAVDDIALCHCRMCQRAHGAPAVSWLVVARSDFRLLQGTPGRYRSSDKAVREFCRDGGTPLFFLEDTRPDEIDVAVSTLDDPVDVPPGRHIWVESQMPWLRIDDTLPHYLRETPGS